LRDRYKVGSAEYGRINDALKALGHNGDGNGVVVTVGGDDPNGSTTEVNDKGITVTFGRNLLDARRDIKDSQAASDLTGAVAHEGSHVSKGQVWLKDRKEQKTFDVEVLAYTTQVDMHRQFNSMMREQGKGPYELEMLNGDREGSTTVIYSQGWSEVDVRTAIGTFLERSPKYRLTPQSKDLAFPTKKKGK